MSKILSVFVILFCICGPGTIAAEPIRLGVVENLPPYVFRNDNGELVGIDIEIIRAVFKQLGKPVTVQDYPWARLTRYIFEGKLDGVGGIYLEENEPMYPVLVAVDEPMHETKVSIYARDSSNATLSDLAEHTEKTVGVLIGYEYGQRFEVIDGMKKIKVHTEFQLLHMLKHGRIDYAVMNEVSLLYTLKQFSLTSSIKSVMDWVGWPIQIALSKNNLGEEAMIITRQLSNIIKEMKADGSIERIKIRYR